MLHYNSNVRDLKHFFEVPWMGKKFTEESVFSLVIYNEHMDEGKQRIQFKLTKAHE